MNPTTHTYGMIVLVVLALASSGCVTDESEPLTPPTTPTPPATATHPNATEIAPAELLGMKKMVVSTGADALRHVDQLHIGKIENIYDVAIIHYIDEDGRLLTLWTTLYENETLASGETEKMVVGIRKFGGDWAPTLEEITIGELTVYRIAPDDLPQYFWADGVWVFYIKPHDFTPDECFRMIEAIP